MVNMGVEPRTLALLAPRSKPTELIDQYYQATDEPTITSKIYVLAFQFSTTN
jgi:cytochrome oxidase Cu insertion factor (SCO1/SenC/PrrC family)